MDGDAVTQDQISYAIGTLRRLYFQKNQSPRQFKLQNYLTQVLKKELGQKRLVELIDEWKEAEAKKNPGSQQ